MKEKLTLRNVILWTAALALIVTFYFSFGATVKLTGHPGGTYVQYVFTNALWKTKTAIVTGEEPITIPEGYRLSSGLGIAAVLMLLFASIGLVLISFLVKDEKVKKVLIFVCAGLILAGGVMLFFLAQKGWKEVANMTGEPLEEVKEMLKMYGFKASSPYGTGAGIVSILFSVAIIGTQTFIPEVKFIK